MISIIPSHTAFELWQILLMVLVNLDGLPADLKVSMYCLKPLFRPISKTLND